MKRQLLPFLLAMLQADTEKHAARIRPTGGHRRRGYIKTEADHLAMAKAEARQLDRAAKRHADYLRCLANNPCLGGGSNGHR